MRDGVDGNGKFDTFSISGADHWYTLPSHRVRAINNDLAQRTFLPGWLRAVGPGWIGWGVESFMDELAAMTGEDPVEFRLKRLDAAGKNAGTSPNSVGGAARLAAALRDVAKRSGWGRQLPAGEGMGVAVSHGQERNMPTWTACVAHVAVDAETKAVTVKKIWQTIDCGTVVHPDGAMAQAEGATLWGLSLALHEGTAFEAGQVKDRNLDTYTATSHGGRAGTRYPIHGEHGVPDRPRRAAADRRAAGRRQCDFRSHRYARSGSADSPVNRPQRSERPVRTVRRRVRRHASGASRVRG